jgi:hypothetical protein
MHDQLNEWHAKYLSIPIDGHCTAMSRQANAKHNVKAIINGNLSDCSFHWQHSSNQPLALPRHPSLAVKTARAVRIVMIGDLCLTNCGHKIDRQPFDVSMGALSCLR